MKALHYTRLLRGKNFEGSNPVPICLPQRPEQMFNKELRDQMRPDPQLRFAVPRTTFEVCYVDLGLHIALHPLEKRLK